MLKQPALAFLVADRGRAQLLLRHSDGRYDVLAEFEAPPRFRPRRDTRVRVYASVGTARSTTGDATSSADRRAFAAELAAGLERALARGAFERLVLVAPARMLADLRRELSGAVARTVVDAAPKDLTKLPQAELRRVLDDIALSPSRAAAAD